MNGRLYFMILLLAASCRAEIIDRVAVAVGKGVITDSDIRLEIRLSSFINGAEPDLRPDSRRKTADRLIERALIQTEMEIGRYPAPQEQDVEPDLAELKKERFPTEDAYRKALAQYRLTEADLKKYLLQQRAVLGFIDARFGPAVQVMETEMHEYYTERFRQQWENKNGKPVPPFDEVRTAIEDALRAERADRLLEEWLKEGKRRARIEFRDEAFQ
jgi:hypothetical protein